MNFIKDSFKYSFKNFFKLLILVLPISILMGFLRPYKTIEFLSNFRNIQISSYLDMLKSTISFSAVYWVLCIVAFVLLVFTISALLAGIDYHLRSGKFSFIECFKRAKYFLLPVLSVFLIFIIFGLILMFLMPAVNYFIHYMLSKVGNIPTKTTYFVCLLVFLIGYLILFMVLTILFSVINLIAINGYNLKSALSNSFNLLENNFFKFLTGLLLPFVLIIPVVWFTNDLTIFPLICIVLFALQLIFSISLSMIAYFNLTKTERKDNPQGYFIKGIK